MKHGKLTLVAAFVCAAALGASLSSAHAAQITNVSASTSSYYPSTSLHPVCAVNGAGLSGSMHTNVQINYMWVADVSDIDGAYLIIDLKKNYKLDLTNTLKVWNYNNTGDTDQGFKSATFSYSLDSVTFTEVTGATTDATNTPATFDEANGLNTYSNYNTVAFNSTPTARYIKITVNGGVGTGNYGGTLYVGLSEVQAFGTFVSDPTNSLGEQITVSNVTASSTYSGTYGAGHLIDGSGLSGLTHGTSGSDMWLSTTAVLEAYVDFDLGVSQKLGVVRIWNHNWSGFPIRAMQTVDILTSDDGSFTTGVITNHNNIELLIAPYNLQDYDNPQIFDMDGVEGRYVRISNVGNSNPAWGDTYIGLSEVQFFLFVPPSPPSGTVFSFH